VQIQLEESWKALLHEEFEKDYFKNLLTFVKEEYQSSRCFPPDKFIFKAFNACTFANARVVILGQDPYHGDNQANGLCFSVNDGMPLPPSLKNIFKEIQQDLGSTISTSGNLQRWASQGVLMLNATLTVRAGMAGSHQKKGWEEFTDRVISSLNTNKKDLVFLLWGNYAQNKGRFIDTNKHLVLKAKHPSPLSANFGGWFGQKHFSQTNYFLVSKGLKPIDWH
jgi:uracil-DNA glycosylase